jgi:signal peptidase
MKAGSMLITRPVNPEDIKLGDIIAFRVPGGKEMVVHRVVDISMSGDNQYRFVTRGDAIKETDYVIDESDIIGRLYLYIPLAGYLIWFIIILTVAVIILLIRDRIKYRVKSQISS